MESLLHKGPLGMGWAVGAILLALALKKFIA